MSWFHITPLKKDEQVDYTFAGSCRCCGSENLERVLDLGRQPLANSYVREPTKLPAYPLELMVCQKCFHNQLSVVVNPELMFRHYLYVSGTSRTLREHFTAFAHECLKWIDPRPVRVLDLACNDGTLLAAFRSQGCIVQGVDPAKNLVQLAAERGIDVVEGYWPEARDRVTGPFDLVTAANVMAHVADPVAFLRAMIDVLTPHGAAVLEFPYARDLVVHREWDTIYHEHLSYFLVGPFLKLAERAGVVVTRVKRVPNHGGSLRLMIQKAEKHCPEILALAEAEREAGLYSLPTYAAFAQDVEGTCRDLVNHIRGLIANGRRVVGYGASAKGNTLLNKCPLPLAWIADDNPLKHGYLTPGNNIPILSNTELTNEPAGLGIVLLAWNFAEEILANIHRLRPGRKDEAIYYVPEFRSVSL